MKKYFTKYLPLDEEVLKNDKFIGTDGAMLEKIYISSGTKKGHIYTSPLSYRFPVQLCKKVKLYLCSRHIKVGNEYYNEQFAFTQYPNKSIVGSSSNWVGENGSYKIIGEISPLAIFASEGMELTEDDVQASHEYKDGLETKWDRDEILCYKIKCDKCNTYH